MPRTPKHRCCRSDASGRFYKPRGVPMRELECIKLELDEFEAMRLCDMDLLDQTEAGERMGVSRGTIQRLLESARKKLIQAIVEKHGFQIGILPTCCGRDKRCES